MCHDKLAWALRVLIASLPPLFVLDTAGSAQLTIANKGSSNPTLLYRGKPCLKVGPLPEVAVFAVEWGSRDFPHEQWLDWMQEHGLGYGRVYPENGQPWMPHDGDRRVFPFEVVRWRDGKPIVDLTKPSRAYWDNFARVIRECADRGIILHMQLYQRVFFQSKLWPTNYFHPDNNVNGYPIPPGSAGYGLWKVMAEDAPWRDVHRQWVEHVLDGIGDAGNVLIDLMNEGAYKNALTQEWIDYTLDIIEGWEQRTGNDLLIGMDFDHFFKKQDPGLEYILSHPRMDLVICEGSEAHVVKDLFAGDRRKQKEELAVKYRLLHNKPVVSANSPTYSAHENPEHLRLYQWYSMMVKLQGVGLYAKTYPLDFSDAPVEQYARESKTLVSFFEELRDYVSLDLASDKIADAPGEYRLALASARETVVYLHTGGSRETIPAGRQLALRDLEMPDAPVSVTLVRPSSGKTAAVRAAVSDGKLALELPEFFEDLAVHIVPR
jgi:hypothetical protein